MRNALILLAVVALLILAVGALNNGTVFDIDYVAGTVSSVSLLWVSAVIAALVFVVGLAAAWFAQAAMTGSRRKLEAELQSTYERLREAEALAARRAPVVETAAPAHVPRSSPRPSSPSARGRRPSWRPRRSPSWPREAETVVERRGDAAVADEAATVLEPGEAETAVRPDAEQVAAEEPAAEAAGRRADRDHHGRRPPAGRGSGGAGRRRERRGRRRRTTPTGPDSPPPERAPAASVAPGRYTRAVMHS